MAFTLGIDYGTNSVRALFVDVSDGRELATCVVESGGLFRLLKNKDARYDKSDASKVRRGAEYIVALLLPTRHRPIE